MSRLVDLDELAAARAEGKGEPPTIRFKGETFTLAPEMPIAVVEAWVDNADASVFGQAVLGSEWERFKALGPSQDDIWALGARTEELWGVDSGESEASGEPSESNGARSRPTSNGSTESTSAKRSGGRKRSASADSAP